MERIVQAEGTPCREPRRTDGGGNEREERRKNKRSRGGWFVQAGASKCDERPSIQSALELH